MPIIAYYVSGHGFGHARRTAEVLRALCTASGDVRVVVRTSAPSFLFRDIPRVTVSAPERPFDPGVVERGPLCIDPDASMQRLKEILEASEEIIRGEAAFLRKSGARLVAADIPFLAGDAAEAAGVPGLAVGNFTWDWIYESYATPVTRPLIDRVRASHRKFDALLQLPLGHGVTSFRRVMEMPLVAGRPRAGREQTLHALGIDPADRRPRVLVGMRGGLPESTLVRVATESPGFLFLVNQTIKAAPPNLGTIDSHAGLDFTDILAVCGAVVSKLGYGIISDCIAAGASLLYPRREGFREDEIMRATCPRFLRMRELATADYESGAWGDPLVNLLRQPPPPESPPTDGAAHVAEHLRRAAAAGPS